MTSLVSMQPAVSVVVPAFNAGAYITETLQSLVAQTYRPVEIIVVDDGSTDDTCQRVASFGSRVKYVRQAPSGGPSAPRNAGIALASGDFVTVFDADDVMLPDKIRRQVAFLDAHADAGCVLMDYRHSGRGQWDRTHFESCPTLTRVLRAAAVDGEMVLVPDEAKGMLLAENFSIAGSPLFRREALDAVGLYDTSLKAGEDFELQYRFSSRYATGVIDAVGFLHREHGGNITADRPRMLRGLIQSRRTLLANERDGRLRAVLAKTVGDLYLEQGYYYGGRDNWVATQATVASLRFRQWPIVPPVRNFARILASPFRARFS
jgi:glycosyltransferase involved in cell wall biosynthesis